jgi:hypothetical protein
MTITARGCGRKDFYWGRLGAWFVIEEAGPGRRTGAPGVGAAGAVGSLRNVLVRLARLFGVNVVWGNVTTMQEQAKQN